MLGNMKSHHKVFKTNCDGEVNYVLLCCTVDECHSLRLSQVLAYCPVIMFLNVCLFLTGFKASFLINFNSLF